ncbi:MAG: biopolymer transporter ExbD [Muribaculaceae bacterium]|nr:biopolymer transporter ExbD [Muribaculaceae bacterium]MDE6756032.1 biopolymer transporter ExbD [Muribaculaceae bacterium]
MAQIEQSDGGKKKKGAQKKMHIHVDFTPMVDMNMLLITFFMLCTTMIKSQTLSIALPAPPDPNQERTQDNSETVAETKAITLIIDSERDKDGNIVTDADGNPNDVVYYYFGFEPTIDENKNVIFGGEGFKVDNTVKAEKFIGNDGSATQGIRRVLHDRNAQVLEKLESYKDQWRRGKITEEEFQNIAREVRNDSTFTTRPQVTVKATPQASWQSVISALDEMQINQISQYRIGSFTPTDSLLIVDYKRRNPAE